MPTPATGGEPANYLTRLSTLTLSSFTQLLRPVSHPQSGEAARKLQRHASLLIALGAVAVVALMFGFDAHEISLMPSRGAPDLWPIRILTDFGKAANVNART